MTDTQARRRVFWGITRNLIRLTWVPIIVLSAYSTIKQRLK